MNTTLKKIILNLVLIVPALYLVYEIMVLQNINDPIKYIYTFTGVCAIVLILFSVLISTIKNRVNLIKYRKIVGLFGFFYAFLHFLNFVVFDAEFSLSFIVNETIKKPFIYLGVISFVILFFMAITSIKSLYKKYNNYHKLVYISILSFFIHTIMAQKSIVLIDVFFIIVIVFIGFLKLYQYKILFK